MMESPFIRVADLQACDFIKKRLQPKCFPMKFAKFLRKPFFTEHPRWLLLHILCSELIHNFLENVKCYSSVHVTLGLLNAREGVFLMVEGDFFIKNQYTGITIKKRGP